MTLNERILSQLSIGQNNAVPLEALINATGAENRVVRKTIEQLRRNGTVIISTNNGYFIPENVIELRRFINKESKRAKSIFYTLKSARKLEKEMISKENQESFFDSEVC